MSKPLFIVDRVGWNRTWEDKLAKAYGSRDIPYYTGPNLMDQRKATWDAIVASDSWVQFINAKVKELCILQQALSQEAARRYAEDEFESKWKSCTSEAREEWILEGMVRTCEAIPYLEQSRLDCPEVTLPRLNKGNGQPFLDLLQALRLEDITKVPAEPKVLPSDCFDRMNGHKIMVQNRGRQLLQLTELTNRMHFLDLFVFNVLSAFVSFLFVPCLSSLIIMISTANPYLFIVQRQVTPHRIEQTRKKSPRRWAWIARLSRVPWLTFELPNKEPNAFVKTASFQRIA